VPNFLVEGGSAQSVYEVGVIPSSIGKRSSARLAAKKKLKIGRNRNAIVKAQEILVAKLNNSASSHFQNSKASFSNDQVDLVEQLARHFSRPLTKEQMEAIMELANQGKKNEGIKKKGSKVTPLQAPIIKASEMR
jgi:molybdopterin-binding protein